LLQAQGQKHLLCHHVVAELVDVAHHIGQRRRLQFEHGCQRGGHLAIAHYARQLAAQMAPHASHGAYRVAAWVGIGQTAILFSPHDAGKPPAKRTWLVSEKSALSPPRQSAHAPGSRGTLGGSCRPARGGSMLSMAFWLAGSGTKLITIDLKLTSKASGLAL
jgi:hypothetical protein